jgi:predicted esterase
MQSVTADRASDMPMLQILASIVVLLGLSTAASAQKRQHDLASQSAQACQAQEHRAYVAHEQGRECIAYRYFEQSWRPKDPVLIFLHGDLTQDQIASATRSASLLENLHAAAKNVVLMHAVKILIIERPGTFGSSGNHFEIRRTRLEAALVSGAIDHLKEKLNVTTFSVAGQSGGASVAAGILTLGRTDIACAVLASGGYELAQAIVKAAPGNDGLRRQQQWLWRYNVADDIDGIAKSEKRRIVVIADTNDRVVPFAGQQRLATALTRKGHSAQFQPVRAQDENRHVLENEALRVAARCANQLPADMWFANIPLIEQKRR